MYLVASSIKRASTEGDVSNSSNPPDEKSGTLALTDGEVLGETDSLALADGDKLDDALGKDVYCLRRFEIQNRYNKYHEPGAKFAKEFMTSF